jgi:hypothetical protein
MRALIPALLLLLSLASGEALARGTIHANAGGDGGDCRADSPYAAHLSERSLILVRENGAPKTVLMRSGRLFLDERWVVLSEGDAARVDQYEREARAALPLAAQIAREAAQIAFSALADVAAGLSDDPAATRAKLARVRARLDLRLARSVSATRFSSDGLASAIASAVREFLPSVVGELVGGMVRTAVTGDAPRLQRMEQLDREIERRIAPRARRLQHDAARLCHHLRSLDQIDEALAYRLPGGRRLDLITVRPSWQPSRH